VNAKNITDDTDEERDLLSGVHVHVRAHAHGSTVMDNPVMYVRRQDEAADGSASYSARWAAVLELCCQ
jgi:hypothetical protein